MKRFSLITLLLFVFLSISNAIELTESNIVESIENTELSKDGLLAKDILNFIKKKGAVLDKI